MPTSYHTRRPDESNIICGAGPEVIRDFLRREDWPPGRYEVTQTEVPFGHPCDHWGVAVKHADGSVELIPDQPA